MHSGGVSGCIIVGGGVSGCIGEVSGCIGGVSGCIVVGGRWRERSGGIRFVYIVNGDYSSIIPY